VQREVSVFASQIHDQIGALALQDPGVPATNQAVIEDDVRIIAAPDLDRFFVEQELFPGIWTFHDHQCEHAR
jgi:hypothetical protein